MSRIVRRLASLVFALIVVLGWTVSAAEAQDTTLTVIIEAPEDPTFVFEVRAHDTSRKTVSLSDGESHTFNIAPFDSTTLDQRDEPGWAKSVVCSGDGDVLSIDSAGVDANLLLPLGTSLTCTFTNTEIPTASLNFLFEAPVGQSPPFEIFDVQLRTTTTVAAGEMTTALVTADEPWLFTSEIIGTAAMSLEPGVDCVGDVDEVTTTDTNVSGTLSAGATVTCTFTATALPSANVTILITDADGAFVHPMVVNGTDFDVTADTPAVFPVAIGDNVSVSPYFFGATAFTSVTCDDPNMVIDPEFVRVAGEMTAAGVTCTWVVDRNTRIRVTIEAPQDPRKTFTVRVGADAQAYFREDMADGETHDFLVVPGVDSILNLTEGIWDKSLSCTGDVSAIIAPGQRRDADLYFEAGTQVDCTFTLTVPSRPADLFPTVTCLAGNGRIDFNIVNTDTVPHVYRVQVGDLSPRQYTVGPNDWWRSPVTGRPDGPIRVTVTQDGFQIWNQQVSVNCDDRPSVTRSETQMMNLCRGGNGFVVWQFANDSYVERSYIIAFEGVPNRSTSAAAFGASVRAVSGRPDGTYNYSIESDGEIIDSGSVTVACD